ncbi:hypothetical protein LCGC14_2353990 [marine sediment metagenome]|uniref:Uncharacterized protein n=1 Tax=marine sediment metagenome TaxID=412755 RepID=A0A0F9F3A3_9ZZZZ
MKVIIRRYLNFGTDAAEYYDNVDVVQCDKNSGACIVWVGAPEPDKTEPHDIVVTIQRTDKIIRSDTIDIWVVGESFDG